MITEVFNRNEIKYILSKDALSELTPLLEEHMNIDIYNKDGKTYPISNLYFDTPSDELIIKSLEKPVYKEKLRLRSYGQAKPGDTVYLELKKKFKGTVTKRRTPMTLEEAYSFIQNGKEPDSEHINIQVFNEIKDILSRYQLKPKVFISYDRLAYFEKNNSDFRLTIDQNILGRRDNLSLETEAYGDYIFKKEMYLMEAKALYAFPLWFVHFLSKNKIFPSSFSKYGNEYMKHKRTQE